MHTLRRILRAYRLAFISNDPNSMIRENLRRFLRYRRFPGNQDAPFCSILMCFVKYGSRVLSGDKAVMSCNPTGSNKNIQRDLINGHSILNKVVWSIHMGTVVGAHGKSRQVT